jgi:hypothetical protein
MARHALPCVGPGPTDPLVSTDRHPTQAHLLASLSDNLNNKGRLPASGIGQRPEPHFQTSLSYAVTTWTVTDQLEPAATGPGISSTLLCGLAARNLVLRATVIRGRADPEAFPVPPGRHWQAAVTGSRSPAGAGPPGTITQAAADRSTLRVLELPQPECTPLNLSDSEIPDPATPGSLAMNGPGHTKMHESAEF